MDFKEKDTTENVEQTSVNESQLQGGLSNQNSSPPPSPDDGNPFVDNRPELQEQLNMQELANNSPQNQEMMAIQDMVNNSPRTMETERFQEITIGLNPTTPVETEVPQQEEVSLDTTDEKDTVDNGEGGGDDSGSSMPPPMETPPPPTPDKDPDFIATTERSEKESDKQTQHESAESASSRAQKSAVSPSNEKRSQAATGQVESMDRQEPKQFNAHQFKQMLKAKIVELLPKDEDEADKFASSGKMKKVGDSAKSQVKTEKQNAAGNIENTTKQPLDPSSIPDREVEQLANPDFGQKPKDLNADKAMPKPLSDQQVEAPLDQGPQDLETQMKDNEITDEQLANSNEPQFISALGAKNDVKTHSDESKEQFRAQENQQLVATKQEADNTGKQGMESMYGDRKNALMGMLGEQQKSSGDNTSERARVSNEINAIYDQTKSDVEGILNGLDTIVGNMFKQATDRAGRNFENYIAARMKAYKDERYDGAAGWLVAGYDYFAGLPDEVNVFFVTARENYLREMDGHLTQIANIVANHLQEAKKRIAKGRQDVNNYVNDLPDNLKDIGKEAAASIQSKFDSLDKQVEDKQGELVDSLAKQYVEAVQAMDTRIEELKAANRGLLAAAWDAVAGVIEVINEARKTLTDLLSKALDAIGVILLDPIGAWNNIVEGVSQGLNNFVGNIGKHLLNGVVDWLTGAMGDVDIEMPENLFSLEGMFSLVGQVLGLSWEYFREKAVQHLGERTVNRLERVYEVFNVVKEGGLAGLWEYLKDQFTNIKEMVLEEIRNMLIMQVVEAGIEWLLGMLVPGGAFIKAVKLIIDVVKFFIENWDNIIAMVTAFVDTISAVAYGNIGVMAAAIEQAMANTIPVIIGFLASLVGLDGMGKKVQGVIEGIRGKVDEVIEAIIGKAKQWFADTRGGRKKSKNKDKDKDKDKEGDEKPDERDDAAQKQDFDKAMNKGEKELNSPDNTKDEIISKVQGIKLKYKLEELKPLLKQNNEEAETWILSGELGKYVAQKEIKRQPSSDTRTMEEKKAALKDAAFEVKVLTEKGKDTENELTPELNKIKEKHRLKEIKLVEHGDDYKIYVSINPEWELPLPEMHSSKELRVGAHLGGLGFNNHEVGRMLDNLKKTKGGDKLADYILGGQFDSATNYKKLISKIEGSDGSVIPAVLQAIETADRLVGTGGIGVANIQFEKDRPSEGIDIDLQVVIGGNITKIFQFKTVGIQPENLASKLGDEIRGAAKQLKRFRGTAERWIEIKLVYISKGEYDSTVSERGRSAGQPLTTTVPRFSRSQGIKLRLVFMKGGTDSVEYT